MEDSIFVYRIIDNTTDVEVNYAVDTMKRMSPNIKNLVSPVLDVAYDVQFSVGGINRQKISGTDDGVWHNQISVNATTAQFYTEKYVTYTMVSVPRQKKRKNVIREKTLYFGSNSIRNTTLVFV